MAWSKKSNSASNKNEYMYKLIKSFDTFVVVDTESTGFQPNDQYSKLLEIGAVVVKEGKIIKTFQELIDPQIKISKKITEVTGITNEMVEHKRTYTEVLKDFWTFCGNGAYPFVFHNARHDLNFLNFFGNKIGQYYRNDMAIDTLLIAKDLIPKGNTPDYKLETLAKRYKIDDNNHHRALNDAEVTAKLLFELIKNIDLTNISTVSKLTQDNDTNSELYEVKRVAPWKKEPYIYRIYVKLKKESANGIDEANVYFDFKKKEWGIKDSSSNEPINFEVISEKVIEYMGFDKKDYNNYTKWEERRN